MRLDNVIVVIKREYLQRVRSKGFWIATLILPLFASGMTVLPGLLIAKSKTSQKIVAVDETQDQGIAHALAQEMAKTEAVRETEKKPAKEETEDQLRGRGKRPRMAQFEISSQAPAADRQAQRKELDQKVAAGDLDAWVWIGQDVLEGKRVEYHARNTSNVFTQDSLEDDLSAVVNRVRLQQAGIDPERVDALTQKVRLAPMAVGEGRTSGGVGGMIFALILFFILYIAILMWGQQVMQGVLDEKGSRVIEVLISALSPFELMMGKLMGICLVGLTQLAIWLGTIAVISAPGTVALAMMPEGNALPSLTPMMLVHFGLLFILGFFAYATLYAAIGASFNNLQEAQQAASVAVIFVVIPAMVMYPIINDPNSTMATVLSLIPLFTPLLMPLRIAIEMPPAWQLGLAYLLTLTFVWGMVWLCSRIYRVGILMYGKKPTFKEIWKWTRYA
jgi:ABC-2 type transport system permease protein